MNPVHYVIASVTGAGLRDEGIPISFRKMIYRKIKTQQTGTSFPLSVGNLFEELNKYDQIKEIPIIISLPDDSFVPKNRLGYGAPESSVISNQI